MRSLCWIGLMLCFLTFVTLTNPDPACAGESTLLLAQQQTETSTSEKAADEEDEYDDDDDEYADEGKDLIPDPFEGFNRGIYHFNDKLYFWLLKPVARGYGFIVPREIRTCVVNFFYNIRFPIRFIDSLLQAKWGKAQAEFCRFFINSTVGFAGIGDVAQHYPSLNPSREDLGQSFAVWGFDSGAYLMLPLFGPSSFRDGLGRLGDTFIDPIWWVPVEMWTSLAIRAGESVNETSLRIGDYEALKQAAFDPYIAIRNAYVQNRRKMIEE